MDPKKIYTIMNLNKPTRFFVESIHKNERVFFWQESVTNDIIGRVLVQSSQESVYSGWQVPYISRKYNRKVSVDRIVSNESNDENTNSQSNEYLIKNLSGIPEGSVISYTFHQGENFLFGNIFTSPGMRTTYKKLNRLLFAYLPDFLENLPSPELVPHNCRDQYDQISQAYTPRRLKRNLSPEIYNSMSLNMTLEF